MDYIEINVIIMHSLTEKYSNTLDFNTVSVISDYLCAANDIMEHTDNLWLMPTTLKAPAHQWVST